MLNLTLKIKMEAIQKSPQKWKNFIATFPFPFWNEKSSSFNIQNIYY